MYSAALRISLGVALLGLAGRAADPRPSQEEQERFLAESREAALRYTQSLPDFICTQEIRRFSKTNRTNWQRLDILTVRLTTSFGGEEYKLVEVNRTPTDRSYESVGGTISRGEFGSLLHGIFDPRSAAEFHFERWTSVNGQRAALYSYRVDIGKARFQLQSFDAGLGLIISAQVGQSGEVAIDRETRAVYRITSVAAKIPRGFPIRYSSFAVTYDYADIGGRRYLLPSKAVSEGATERGSTRNETEFLNYRKFTAGSAITFGTEAIDKR
jgi:hypothetical protein